jgi:hypothetical protein
MRCGEPPTTVVEGASKPLDLGFSIAERRARSHSPVARWRMIDPADALQALTPNQRAARQRIARLRIAGVLILGLGIVGACVLYWIDMRSASPTLEELIPGSTAARERQVGILIGSLGVYLLEGWENLQRPGTEAIIIVGVAARVALGCFHVAALLARDHDSP